MLPSAQGRTIAPSAAKVLVRKGWKVVVTAQLEFELIPGQESAVTFLAFPERQVIEATISLPTSSQVVNTDIDSAMAFRVKELRQFLGLINTV